MITIQQQNKNYSIPQRALNVFFVSCFFGLNFRNLLIIIILALYLGATIKPKGKFFISFNYSLFTLRAK